MWVADINGDGRNDYLWHNGGLQVALTNNVGSGFVAVFTHLAANAGPGGTPIYNDPAYMWMADVDGDGAAEYLWHYNGLHAY
jgi:hypothetical protein